MIQIGSGLHKALKDANPPKDLMWEMLAEKDLALNEVIDALKTLGEDGWSEAPNLLRVCRKARSWPHDPPLSSAE
jgi:hypothetical protein